MMKTSEYNKPRSIAHTPKVYYKTTRRLSIHKQRPPQDHTHSRKRRGQAGSFSQTTKTKQKDTGDDGAPRSSKACDLQDMFITRGVYTRRTKIKQESFRGVLMYTICLTSSPARRSSSSSSSPVLPAEGSLFTLARLEFAISIPIRTSGKIRSSYMGKGLGERGLSNWSHGCQWGGGGGGGGGGEDGGGGEGGGGEEE
ncbi:uncharacterized protein LOC135198286 [Macrobrachium nipponense]|uniref:uncharacterized protein LOC135198286 n=1 Tax=Macrobrachium nipponense TaxID=159736 RepID=UPI0030C837D0